jgi:hypothetical protein
MSRRMQARRPDVKSSLTRYRPMSLTAHRITTWSSACLRTPNGARRRSTTRRIPHARVVEDVRGAHHRTAFQLAFAIAGSVAANLPPNLPMVWTIIVVVVTMVVVVLPWPLSPYRQNRRCLHDAGRRLLGRTAGRRAAQSRRSRSADLHPVARASAARACRESTRLNR